MVPELIDLARWWRQLAEIRRLLALHGAVRGPVLSAQAYGCAAARRRALRRRSPISKCASWATVRATGSGGLARELKLENTVTWLGDVSRAQLAAEYNRCHTFCLPSVQEGFGIVLLEAMAAGKPIVASRAAAVPEVAPYARLVEPDDEGALAEALLEEYRQPGDRERGLEWVRQFDAARVAEQFVERGIGGLAGRS